MPSFDIVSEVDMHELTNAVDQANREIGTRFDFKGTDAKVEQNDAELRLDASAAFQVEQVYDVLIQKMAKRGIDLGCIERGKLEVSGTRARQTITIRQGVDSDTAKKIVKMIKDGKLKVQAQIQGDKVRVTGKKRDDLQTVIAMLKEQKLSVPLQYNNFRD
jgi:uncharacterized protein YajQ (UPF0234 family)